ncbi:MAG: PatB family C-S lyase [Bacteroidales bacterium]|nr:PatB family C-S lyase [Bacteroidales bacterium]
MEEFNFDEIIDRRNTYSVKYDALKTLFGRDDITPLWVADMEFRSPKCIRDVLEKYVQSGVYGYNSEPAQMKPTIAGWMLQEHEWKVESDWISFIPGIVRGIGLAVNFFTKPGDKVVVQSPVYHPFTNVPLGNGRKVLRNPLKEGKMDLDSLDSLLSAEGPVKMMILCSPHNPGGYLWSREDLTQLAEICHRHGTLVISDEIHADLNLWGNRNISFASVSDIAAENSITFGAPSKTFNIPGFASSFSIIPNPELAKPFYAWLSANELNCPSIFASMGMITAYTEGKPWRDAALRYIEGNIIYLEEKFAAFRAGGEQLINPVRPQSSYLVWLDCRNLLRHLAGRNELKLEDQPLLVDYFVNKARIGLNDGTMFGPEGLGFMRLNAGCPRSMLGFDLPEVR